MINLKPFCEAHVARDYGFSEPFAAGGYLYATDRSICVRVPTDLPDATGRVPNAREMWANYWQPTTWTDGPLPAVTTPAMVPCETCAGTGKVATCEACDGQGWFITPDAAAHACRECGGTGLGKPGSGEEGEACDACDGKGQVPNTGSVEINGVRYSIPYLEALRALPNPRAWCITDDRVLLVRGDGWEALVMYNYA